MNDCDLDINKKTIKEKIIEVLEGINHPLASHEFPYIGTNENTIATRLSELATEKKVIGRYRNGKHYKEWFLAEGQLKLL